MNGSTHSRPWTASHTPSPHHAWKTTSRQASLNDLAIRDWANTSGDACSPDNHLPSQAHTLDNNDDDDTLTSLPQIIDSVHEPSLYESVTRGAPKANSRHSFTNILTSLEEFRHAAGRRLRPRRSFVHRNSSAIQEEEEASVGKSNSASPWASNRSLSLRKFRRPSEPALAATASPSSASTFQPLQPLTAEPAIQPNQDTTRNINPAGGEGARAAAAMARLVERGKELEDAQCLSPNAGPFLRRMSSISSDNESGIDIDKAPDAVPLTDSVVSRRDPADLPTEIFTKVLAFLDSDTLMHAELVSTRWREIAQSQHVWKYAFRREFTEPAEVATGSTNEVPAGGFGRGIHHGYQPWKQMWQTRKRLDQRWKDGRAAAIYLVGHHDSVYCVQFDEKKIITGSRDWTVRVWDAETLQCTHVLGTPKDVNTIHQPLSARKKQGKQPTVSLVPACPQRPPIQVDSPEKHTGSVLCIDYDSELMVTGSSDSTIIVWSITNGEYKALQQLRAHSMGVLDVRLNDKYIIACSKDTTVSVWDRHTLKLLRVLNGHRGPVNAVQLRSNFVVSASGDGVAKLWNLTTGLCVKEFHPPGDENVGRSRGLACVEFTHDARTIFAGGNDRKVYQFDTASGNMVRTFKGHESLVRSLHYDAANGRIVTGSYDHAVWTYDYQTGEPVCSFKNWTTSWMLSAKADYRRIVAASQDGKAIVMDFGHDLPGVELLRGY